MDRPPHNESFGCPCENGPRHARAPCSAHGDRPWHGREIAARRLRGGPLRGRILATGLALVPGVLRGAPGSTKDQNRAGWGTDENITGRRGVRRKAKKKKR